MAVLRVPGKVKGSPPHTYMSRSMGTVLTATNDRKTIIVYANQQPNFLAHHPAFSEGEVRLYLCCLVRHTPAQSFYLHESKLSSLVASPFHSVCFVLKKARTCSLLTFLLNVVLFLQPRVVHTLSLSFHVNRFIIILNYLLSLFASVSSRFLLGSGYHGTPALVSLLPLLNSGVNIWSFPQPVVFS